MLIAMSALTSMCFQGVLQVRITTLNEYLHDTRTYVNDNCFHIIYFNVIFCIVIYSFHTLESNF